MSLRKIIHRFFVPSEHNNFRARSIHVSSLLTYLTIAIAIFTIVQSTSFIFISGKILGFATDITESKLLELTNKERASQGLSALTISPELKTAAEKKARAMFSQNAWAHFLPDGTSPWDLIHQSGYDYEYAGENLAHGFMLSDGVVGAWMNSESHRQNIVNPQYQDIGFAIVNGTLNGEETTLVVQMFGKKPNPQKATTLTIQKIAQAAESKTLPIITTSIPPTDQPVVPTVKIPMAATTNEKWPLSLSSVFSFNATLSLILILILALLLDLYYAYKLNLIRVTSKNSAHILFLATIIMSLFLLSRGVIL